MLVARLCVKRYADRRQLEEHKTRPFERKAGGFCVGAFRIYNMASMEPFWKSNGVIVGAVVLGLAVIGVALLYTGAIQIGSRGRPRSTKNFPSPRTCRKTCAPSSWRAWKTEVGTP